MIERASSSPGGRTRARVSYLVSVPVLLALLVPLAILDLDIPFFGAAGMILVGAAVIYSVERWEDPARAKERWGGANIWAGAVVLALVLVAGAYILLFGW